MKQCFKCFAKRIIRFSEKIFLSCVLLFIGLIGTLIIRVLSPIIRIRIGILIGSRIGHFAANTELYLCEKDAGINKFKGFTVDLFYLDPEDNRPVCNYQLFRMWKRRLFIVPAWLLYSIDKVNKNLPGASAFIIKSPSQSDRDIYNLLDDSEPHLFFTPSEESRGRQELEKIGIPNEKKFVCLIVRDSEYLPAQLGGRKEDYQYHNHRDSDIENYVLVAETLAEKGYYVLRMGAKVEKKFLTKNPLIIDYATNGLRSDFMDIYLGAKCFFCISTALGFDAIPYIFRKPIVFVNVVPINYFFSFNNSNIGIFKHHISEISGQNLTLTEIFANGCASATNFEVFLTNKVALVENSPEEIRDACLEMLYRLEGSWDESQGDIDLQQDFWAHFSKQSVFTYKEKPIHGKFKARIATQFLSKNKKLLMD